MGLVKVVCQDGYDYDINSLSKDIPIVLKHLIALAADDNSYLAVKTFQESPIIPLLKELADDSSEYVLACEEEYTFYIMFDQYNLKRLLEFISKDLLHEIQHIYVLNETQTLFEWIDICSDGQADITKNVPIAKINEFCKALNCSAKLYEDV